MHQLTIVLILAAVITASCWILSVTTKDYSWVDRTWSLSPIAYAWIFAWPTFATGAAGLRTLLMATVITLWGIRLTFNFARKGGYSGMEDYRWSIVRASMKNWQWQIFNFLFTSVFQNVLLVLITLPVWLSAQYSTDFGFRDVVLILLFALLLVGETTADQEQWNFQQAKKHAGGHLEPGFVTTGMFHFSRHPNFFCELGQWWVIYALGASALVSSGASIGLLGGVVNWSVLGAVVLTVLFIGSTMMTESISAKKYPAYAEYRRTTSAIIPLPPRKRSTQSEYTGN
ncbi:MAG: DUF1295 domain-containing protein [Bifidobacteriaceae bacterium]|jgi:steroid 5-alpha reductase family enzyme|nr:DUF1295 domain-containing protein [Bifidobacteriaceae bacterium]MCI1914243.1 DUF1295 domain-containing protein [Bifidobacteriaceae bacterium]